MVSIVAAMTSSSTPQAKKVKASQAEIPEESQQSSKETRMSQVEVSNNRPSKKKKRSHREGPKEIPRAEEPPSSKGK